MAPTTSQSDYDDLRTSLLLNHEYYLEQVQDAFHNKCQAIRKKAEDEIAATPEDDEEGRRNILTQEKEDLDKVLQELKVLVNQHTRETHQHLEEMEKKYEESSMDLEAELAKV